MPARRCTDGGGRPLAALHQRARPRWRPPTDAQADLAARALFFTVADAAKIALPLRRAAPRTASASIRTSTLRIVDVGAGCGAMSLGALVELLRRGRSRAGDRPHAASIRTTPARWRSRRAALADLARALGRARCASTVRAGDVRPRRAAALRPGARRHACSTSCRGPTRRRSRSSACVGRQRGVGHDPRRAGAAHDRAGATPAARRGAGRAARGVLAPCTHAQPCPMLATERDWCHEARRTPCRPARPRWPAPPACATAR
jgi:hypothetical protein